MAYNRRNKLKQMQRVLEVYNREKRDGVSTIYIYKAHIYPKFHISLKTLYTILSTPVSKIIKEEDLKKSFRDRQLKMDI